MSIPRRSRPTCGLVWLPTSSSTNGLSFPDARVYRGPGEAKEFWRKTQEVLAELRWEPQEFIDLGHAVVVRTRVVATGRGSQVSTETDETDLFWFRDDLIVRLEGFATKEQALEAAGLRE